MTEQLKQALEALKVAEYRMRTSGDRHSDSYGKVEFAINTLERALTTSQPAQAERNTNGKI